LRYLFPTPCSSQRPSNQLMALYTHDLLKRRAHEVEPSRRSSRLISSVRIICKQTPYFLSLAGLGILNWFIHQTFSKSGFESNIALFISTFVVRNYFHLSDIRGECNDKIRKHLLCIHITGIVIHLANLDSSLEFPDSLAILLYLVTFLTPHNLPQPSLGWK
jgi:hypothetical protein